MVDLDSTHQIWSKLHVYYASQTRARARVKQLRLQLRNPKRDRSITIFLLDIKKTVDTLAAVGSPISTKDHIEAILDGLPEEYDSFVTTITSRLDPYTVEDVESLLLTQEERFESNNIFYKLIWLQPRAITSSTS